MNEFNRIKIALTDTTARLNEMELENCKNREMIDKLVANLNSSEKEALEAKQTSEKYRQV